MTPTSQKLGSYARETIAPGETPLLRAQYHPVMIIVPFCIGLPFMLAALGALIGGTTESGHPPGLAGLGFFLTCLFGWIFYLFPLLRFRLDEIVITDRRLIIKMGIVARQTRELFYSKIESVALDQGILARILNYGTITIRGTGGTVQPCKFIREPLQFRATVQEMQERAGQRM